MHTNEAARLARTLMNEHGLGQWRFEFDRAAKRFGLCKHRERTISLSEPVVRRNEERLVRETILHEIAHALVGPGHGHDAVWKAKARSLGIKGTRCAPAETVTPEGKIHAICPTCKVTVHRFHRMPKRSFKHIQCGTTISLRRVG